MLPAPLTRALLNTKRPGNAYLYISAMEWCRLLQFRVTQGYEIEEEYYNCLDNSGRLPNIRRRYPFIVFDPRS